MILNFMGLVKENKVKKARGHGMDSTYGTELDFHWSVLKYMSWQTH